MVSRVLGLGRDMLVTAVFGIYALASAFYTAFTLPNLFRRLLGEGALTAAFVPTLTEELKHRQRPGAFALLNKVASWLFVVTGAIVAAPVGLQPQTSESRPWAALSKKRRRPTLPGGFPPSTIGAEGLNGSVRNGKRCIPLAIATENVRDRVPPR